MLPTSHQQIIIREINSDDHLADERVIPFVKPPRVVLNRQSFFPNKLNLPSKMFFHPSKPLKSPCNYSLTVTENDCTFELSSYLPTPTRKAEDKMKPAWGKILKYGVDAEFVGSCSMQKQENREEILCKQTLRVALEDNQEWGMVQLRCQNDVMRYRGVRHSCNDILTYFFYRDLEVVNKTVFPPMIIANRFYEQNYFPIIPGQLLMVISDSDYTMFDMQAEGYKCFRLEDEHSMGSKFAAIYHCVDNPQVRETLLMSNVSVEPHHHIGVFMPTVYTQEDLTYMIMFEPRAAIYVNCENINALCIRFINDIPVIRECEHARIERVNTEMHEVLFVLDKELQGLTVCKKNGRIEFKAELR